MQICWNCSSEEQDDEIFCTNCGVDLNDGWIDERVKTILSARGFFFFLSSHKPKMEK